MENSLEKKAQIPFPKTLKQFFAQFFGNGSAAHPTIQFFKYVFVGGISSAILVGVFYMLAYEQFPALQSTDLVYKLLVSLGLQPVDAASLGDNVRANNAMICNATGFFISIVVCYLLNRAFVFVPGKLSIWLEFFLFVLSASIAIAMGSGVLKLLIVLIGAETTYGFLANMITSTLVNYACRKYVIFKG